MPNEAGEKETYSMGRYRDRVVDGPIVRTLIWLGVPPLLNQIVVVAYTVADAYWLSLYSDVAITVPRQTWPVIMLFQALINALTAACLGIVSQYVGSKNYREASISASRFFTVSFLSGVALSVSLLALRGFVFTEIISTPQEIFEDAMNFSGIIAFDILLNYIALTYTTLLQSVGDTRRPAVVNCLAVGVNIFLDPFLVLGIGPFPRLGVVGAAITDVFGKIISISVLNYIIREKYPDLKVAFTRKIGVEWMGLVLRIGLPVLTLGLLNGFAFLIQLRIVNMLGIIAATAYAVGFIVLDIVDAALWGLSGANAIMVGQNLGAGNNDRAMEIAYKFSLLIFVVMALGSGLIYPLSRDIVNVFTEDPDMIAETELFLKTLLPTLPFFGLFMVAMSTGRGSGHTLFPTIIGILRLWGIRVGLGYFLAFTMGMGALGAWLAIGLSNVAGGILSILWIKYGGWNRAVIRRRAGF